MHCNCMTSGHPVTEVSHSRVLWWISLQGYLKQGYVILSLVQIFWFKSSKERGTTGHARDACVNRNKHYNDITMLILEQPQKQMLGLPYTDAIMIIIKRFHWWLYNPLNYMVTMEITWKSNWVTHTSK